MIVYYQQLIVSFHSQHNTGHKQAAYTTIDLLNARSRSAVSARPPPQATIQAVQLASVEAQSLLQRKFII